MRHCGASGKTNFLEKTHLRRWILKRSFLPLFVFSVLLILFGSFQFFAQTQEPNEVIITIVNVQTGKQLDYIRYQVQQEAIDKEAGVPITQWYVHENGASWDYVSIRPVLTPEQEKKVDEVSKQKGVPSGFKAGLKFRTFISSHSDTFARGPMSMSELLKEAE
jgi:hypothetical protein